MHNETTALFALSFTLSSNQKVRMTRPASLDIREQLSSSPSTTFTIVITSS